MRFAIKNLKNNYHTISRLNGSTISIEPNSFVVIDTDDDTEIQYWLNCNKQILKKSGLSVITNDKEIDSLALNKGISIRKDISVVDGFASPVVEQEMKDNKPVNTDNYSQEHLLSMDKEDLFNICENFGIKYKRSNSVKTLVNLILGSGKL